MTIVLQESLVYGKRVWLPIYEGGPGSGIKGHTTFHPELHSKIKSYIKEYELEGKETEMNELLEIAKAFEENDIERAQSLMGKSGVKYDIPNTAQAVMDIGKEPEKKVRAKPIGYKDTSISFGGMDDFKQRLTSDENILDELSFENKIVDVDGIKYYLTVEGWYPDCMESRGYGKTDKGTIERNYLDIMKQETGLEPDMHGYIPDSKGGEYGVSYILQKMDV